MKIDLYHSPHCKACESLVERWAVFAEIRRMDVCMHLEAAAALGISRPPALVVDGQLVAQGPKVIDALRALLEKPEGQP